MDEFLEQFLIESRENVDSATSDLLALETQGQDRARLDSVFRGFHTLKGGAGIVGFDAMARALHVAEDQLSRVRSGSRPVTPKLIGDCLACLERVTAWLDAIEATGDVPTVPQSHVDALVARLEDAADVDRVGHVPSASPASSDLQPHPPLGDDSQRILDAQLALLAAPHADRERAGRIASAGRVSANVMRSGGHWDAASRIERAASESLAGQSDEPLRMAIASALTAGPPVPSDVGPAVVHDEMMTRTLRVDSARIDALVDLAGELTVVKNAFAHVTQVAQSTSSPLWVMLKDRQGMLDRLVVQLQQSVLALRVRPLQSVFQRFARVVREMAEELGKPAHLVIEGGQTEADKAIVEMLFEPMLHVVRNAMDHGIEPVSARESANKPARATIRLSAARQDEHVIVEVSDDGAGFSVERIRDVALKRGLATAEALQEMQDDALIDLVFVPGFSTASSVTSISGRGVGMDSVRAAAQRMGGRVTISNHAGRGATVRFTLPFSVMMMQVMIVTVASEKFGIPLDAVVENVRVDADRLVPLGHSEAVVIREQTVPVVKLAEALGLRSPDLDGNDATLMVIRTAAGLGALRVDRVEEPVQVMLKPLEGFLAETPCIAGSAVLGDGSVLLILNLEQVFH